MADLERELQQPSEHAVNLAPMAELRPPTPKVLLFDLGHVILEAKYKTLYEGAAILGSPAAKTRSAFELKEYSAFTRGKIDAHRLCDALRRALSLPNVTDDQIREVHDRHISGLVSGMKELLERITEKCGHDNIVFVTDTCDWQTARQQQLVDLSEYRVITSSEVGMLKSDPEIIDGNGERKSFFLHVIKELNIEPQEALLIDDNAENVEIARRYNIQAIQFMDSGQLEIALREHNVLE
jgi:FMN phosphatase YigB (HAD superfamily)